MESLVLKAPAHPVFQLQAEKSHPRLSLRRVLYVKFLRWVDGASPTALRKAALRTLLALLIPALFVAPQFLLGLAYASVTWHDFWLLKVLSVVGLVAYWRTLQKLPRLLRRKGNQHTYHGLPIDDLATYLFEQKQFTRDHATAKLGISQDKHASIAKELERHAILVRGENNARVLNDITREDLVRQLREKFPLVWSEERKVWAERNGRFERWALKEDRKEREEQEKVARLERKKEKLKDEIEELKSPFRQVLDLAA